MKRLGLVVLLASLVGLALASYSPALETRQPGVMHTQAVAKGPIRDFFSWLFPKRPPLPPPVAPKEVADWGHAAIGVAKAWERSKGEGVVVAVLDTGCDVDHVDLKGQISGGYDFTGSTLSWYDGNGHGTHCAGIIAAAENGVGMVGVAPKAKLLIVKVLSDGGWGTDESIANGIDFAAKHADVISMSLGGGYDERVHNAIKRARARGVIVVVAAGNSGPGDDTVDYPGALDEVVCVAATARGDFVADFSSRGREVDVAAPGSSVRSTIPGNLYGTMSGTSMATPYVAGCAALYVSFQKAKGRLWSQEEFVALFAKTATDIDEPGRDHASGDGLIRVGDLLYALPSRIRANGLECGRGR